MWTGAAWSFPFQHQESRNSPELISRLGQTRALGISKVAVHAGISREAPYKASNDNGNTTLDTLLKVTKPRGVRLGMVA